MAAYDNEEVVAVAREIERYLALHPHAADTVEGIQRWWLVQQRYQVWQVQGALDHLEACGAVSKTVVAGEKIVYSAAPGTVKCFG